MVSVSLQAPYNVISQHTIQQIQSRIDIIEIVGSFVKLKKRGANYLGNCPFHNEKSPSFTVSPSKEIYKCFGCGKSGNTIGFLMDHEKYSYAEALRWLAQKYNVEIEETAVSPEYAQQQLLADSLYVINGFAQKYFTEQLNESEEGQDIAQTYLQERGFNKEIIEKFQIGYCLPHRDSFAKAATAAQYNPELLVKTGLVVNRDNQLMDNYRGRIIFPIHNNSGKVIGFGARVIGKADKAPKYINTPENELYVKSKILYGSYFARQSIDKQDECLLVEGYTDVVSLHQAGIENVVASGGTSLTIDQLRLIKKYTQHLTIIYDGDSAGVKAALRGMDMALEEGLLVKLVLIPDNEDPDSYVNKVGATAFREFVRENKKDFILFQLEVSLKEAGNDSAKKASVVNQIAETISKINKVEDFTRQQDYIKQCSQLLKIEELGLIALVNKYIREKLTKEEGKNVPQAPPSDQPQDASNQNSIDETLQLLQKDEQHERALIRCLLEYGQKEWEEGKTIAAYIFEELEDEGIIDSPSLSLLLLKYKDWHRQGLDTHVKNFLYDNDPQTSQLVVSIMDFKYELSPNWSEHYEGKMPEKDSLYKEDTDSTVNYLKLRKIKRLIEENQQDLEKSVSIDDQMLFLQTHQHLKQLEKTLTQKLGTVILR